MENNYIVYMHISPSDKRYVGITSQKPEYRWNNGKSYSYNTYFTNAINKYGWDNFQHIIIARGLTKEEAEWLEIELIREWDSTNRGKGYNLTKGGEGTNGFKHTEETKNILREKNMGENNPMFGIKGKEHPSYGRNPRDSMTEGELKIYSEKLSKARTGEKNPFYGRGDLLSNGNNPNAKKVICLETMEIFNCIKEAYESVNGSAWLCEAIRKHKKYKGYTFIYYEDYLKMNGEIDGEL